MLLIALIWMILNGWALNVGPEHAMLYHPYPPFKAHIIYYSSGHTFENGEVTNHWEWPSYQYVERR